MSSTPIYSTDDLAGQKWGASARMTFASEKRKRLKKDILPYDSSKRLKNTIFCVGVVNWIDDKSMNIGRHHLVVR